MYDLSGKIALVTGAGGRHGLGRAIALRLAAEGAEDDDLMGQKDLEAISLTARDTVVAISASGYAPYCCAALRYARQVGALAIGLSCNSDTRLSRQADLAIEAPTGPEVLMGSTRLKAGTATKMVLNMLSTGAMVRTIIAGTSPRSKPPSTWSSRRP